MKAIQWIISALVAVVIIAALVIWVIIGSITGLLMVGFAASTVVAAGVL